MHHDTLLTHLWVILYEHLATAPVEGVAGKLLVALEVAPLDLSLWGIYPHTIWRVDALLLLIPVEEVGVKA